MDGVAATAVATVIAAAIGAIAAWATGRSAARAQATVSRSDLEQQAFQRAQGFYTDTIDRQHSEIRELESEVAELRGEVRELRARLEDTLAELDAARRVLALRYPDEP